MYQSNNPLYPTEQAEEEAIQQRDLMEHSQLAAGEAEQGQDDDLYLQVYPLAFKVHTIGMSPLVSDFLE